MNIELNMLREIIRPLGLSYRAERLQRCGKIICEEFNGRVPVRFEELRKLPGVGQYIANATLCYAYDNRTVPIDINVIRLFSRFFGLASDKSRPRTDEVLAGTIRSMFAGFKSTKEPNLAVLDFAGTTCLAKNQKCDSCCLAEGCNQRNGSKWNLL